MRACAQDAHQVRFEWGVQGLWAVAKGVDVIVVVDVLSFSTATDVALTRGARIFPFRYKDNRARAFAESMGASLAVDRRSMSLENPFSLSPRSLTSLRAGTSVVLPSPNGAALALAAARVGPRVITACARNAAAVAQAIRASGSASVAVIAAGEQWEDGSLRPALEDLWGAGAVLSELRDLALSPEARAAGACYWDLDPKALQECSSARELIESGFEDDVLIALERNSSSTVPLLHDGSFSDSAG
jgi:2-phosphosulfolactate phosphatase